MDEPGADRAADLARAKEVASQLGYPYPIGLAGRALIENLNALQRAFIGRQSDLPLPSTILIDAAGRAAVIYKGPVSARQLARDAALLGARPPEILAAAVPFEGKWREPPGGGQARSVALKLTEAGLLDDARSYLEQVMPLYADPGALPAGISEAQRRDELAEIYRFVGAIHHQQEHLSEAEAHYVKSLQIIPDQEAVREELVRLYIARGEQEKAAAQLQAMLDPDRDDFEHLAQLAQLKAELGHPQEAIALYRESLACRAHPDSHKALGDLLRDRGLGAAAATEYAAALEARPGWPLPANNLAWILATHPDETIRDGAEAKRLATLACEATGFRIPPILGTLAAAHAELGEFEPAAKVCLQAIGAAEAFGKPDLATRLRSKLDLYREGRPARDPTLVGGQD